MQWNGTILVNAVDCDQMERLESITPFVRYTNTLFLITLTPLKSVNNKKMLKQYNVTAQGQARPACLP